MFRICHWVSLVVLVVAGGCSRKPAPVAVEWRQRTLPELKVSLMLPTEPTRTTKMLEKVHREMVTYSAEYAGLHYYAFGFDFSYVNGKLDEDATLTAMIGAAMRSDSLSSSEKHPLMLGNRFAAEVSGQAPPHKFQELPNGGRVIARMFVLPQEKRGTLWMAMAPDGQTDAANAFLESAELLP